MQDDETAAQTHAPVLPTISISLTLWPPSIKITVDDAGPLLADIQHQLDLCWEGVAALSARFDAPPAAQASRVAS